MKIALPDELKQWVHYNIKKFKYELKENTPQEIKEKFQKYEEKDLERYKI